VYLTEHINPINRVVSSDLARIEVEVGRGQGFSHAYFIAYVLQRIGCYSDVRQYKHLFYQEKRISEEGASIGASGGQELMVRSNHGKKHRKKKKGKTQCFYYKELGYIRNIFPMYNKAANIDVSSAAHLDSEVLSLVSEFFDDVWVLNPRSSYHVTSNKE
jgi:hypothetical protein